MKFFLFEDSHALNFEPISLTRPVFDIRYGEYNLLKRTEKFLPRKLFGLWTRDNLVTLVKSKYNQYIVNEIPNEDSIWLNARVIWDKNLINKIIDSESSIFIYDNILIGANLKRLQVDEWLDAGGPTTMFHPSAKICNLNNISIVNYLWDFLNMIDESIAEIDTSETRIEQYDSIMIDESNGPVIIDKDTIIEPFTYLSGPVYIGNNCLISSHSKIKNSVIGPFCKIGGEVSGSIFQGFSNKVHDGHLGDSFIGEWVNLGAGTTNSNLKNTYENVSMRINGIDVQSEKMFLGSFIGDHSKTGIGTQINTGTNIGPGCSIIAHSFPKNYIAPFTFCLNRKEKKINFEKFIQTAIKVKNRKQQLLTEEERGVFKELFLSW